MGNTLGLAPIGALPRRSPRREEPLPNPGSFDELHRLCKDVFPAQMDGVKLVVNKVLSSHFQVLPLPWPLLPVPPGLWEGECGALLTSLACGTRCLESGDPLHMLAHLGFSKACWMGRG